MRTLVRRLAPLTAFAAAVLLLVPPMVDGDGGARIGAVFALAGMGGGLAAVVNRLRLDHSDDAVAPSAGSIVVDAISMTGPVWAALCVVFLAVLALGPGQDGADNQLTWLEPVVAAGAGAALVAAMVWGVLTSSRREGVERQVLYESAAIAFMVTVLGAAVYALFESFVDAPRLSMWVVWSVGMAVFTVLSVVRHNRVAC